MAMVKFYSIANVANFPVSPDANGLYFVEDAKRIYRGSTDITEKVQLVSEFANSGVFPGILYVNTTSGAAKVRNAANTAWIDVAQQDLSSYLTDVDVTYANDSTNGPQITVSKNDVAGTAQPLTGVVYDPEYDSTNLTLTLPRVGTTDLVINLPKDNFVRSGTYNTTTHNIELTVGDGTNTSTVTFPAGDLIDTYTAGDTATIELDVTNNQFTGTVKISATAGNIISAESDGIYAAATDISGKVDKVTAATAGDIATFVSGGNVQDSGVAVSTTMPGESSTDATIPTSEAVYEAIVDALTWN